VSFNCLCAVVASGDSDKIMPTDIQRRCSELSLTEATLVKQYIVDSTNPALINDAVLHVVTGGACGDRKMLTRLDELKELDWVS
jgi:hypothetical protein